MSEEKPVPKRRGRPPKGAVAMTAAERARKSRGRRAAAADAVERIEVTFWPMLTLQGSLATVSLLIKDLSDPIFAQIRAELDNACEAAEAISIALWDGSTYGRRQRAYQRRYHAVSFLRIDIDRMRADHMRRLEQIAARTNADFIHRDGRIARARAAEERLAPPKPKARRRKPKSES